MEKHILTSIWSVQHASAGQNIQQSDLGPQLWIIVGKCHNYFYDTQFRLVHKNVNF